MIKRLLEDVARIDSDLTSIKLDMAKIKSDLATFVETLQRQEMEAKEREAQIEHSHRGDV